MYQTYIKKMPGVMSIAMILVRTTLLPKKMEAVLPFYKFFIIHPRNFF